MTGDNPLAWTVVHAQATKFQDIWDWLNGRDLQIGHDYVMLTSGRLVGDDIAFKDSGEAMLFKLAFGGQ